MSSCLSIDAQAGELESQQPWFKEHWGVKYCFPDAEFQCRCTYCHGREHAPPKCDCPHSKCHTLPHCLIPCRHPYHGDVHPYYHNDPIAANPALENKGYIGHEDKEGDGES
jgi:hypothetical protein